jgi:Ni2+-binding GTPase involved in maturation of urease and hydrogenase
MDAASYKLSEQQHESIYGRIKRVALSGLDSGLERPTVVVLGGQPGSGKSALIDAASRELGATHAPVVVNGDDLRRYHPQYEQIFKNHPQDGAALTDPDSREWTRRLLAEAKDGRYNIVFESTMRQTSPLDKTMASFREAGYQLEVKVMATHADVSQLGIRERYEAQIQQQGFGRWTPKESHDTTYTSMPNTLAIIERDKLADKVQVYNRAGEVVYENHLVNGEWQREPGARVAVLVERFKAMPEVQRQETVQKWGAVLAQMEARQANSAEVSAAREVHRDFVNRPQELPNIYRGVADYRLSFAEPQNNPRAIMLGGQPGSGKSHLAQSALNDLATSGRAVIIDSDRMRAKHPLYQQLAAIDPTKAADLTHKDAGAWSNRLTQEAMSNRQNLVIDGTLRDPDAAIRLARGLQEHGYTVEARIMAVPGDVSMARARLRFEEQVHADGVGRFVNPAQHNNAYEGVQRTVAALEKEGVVARIQLVDRNNQPVYDNAKTPTGWAQEPRAAEALAHERSRSWSAAESKDFVAGLQKIVDLASQREGVGKVVIGDLPKLIGQLEAAKLALPTQLVTQTADKPRLLDSIREKVAQRQADAGPSQQPQLSKGRER